MILDNINKFPSFHSLMVYDSRHDYLLFNNFNNPKKPMKVKRTNQRTKKNEVDRRQDQTSTLRSVVGDALFGPTFHLFE